MVETPYEELSCRPRSVLVVDDDNLVRESLTAILAEFCDEVLEASDGVEGLDVLQDHPDVELIVTDINMPRLDGIGFVRQARARRPDLKVLFVSGLQHPPRSETFLAKPFAPRTLVHKVGELLAA